MENDYLLKARRLIAPALEVVWVLRQALEAQQHQHHHQLHMGQSMEEQPQQNLHRHQIPRHLHREEEQVCAAVR